MRKRSKKGENAARRPKRKDMAVTRNDIESLSDRELMRRLAKLRPEKYADARKETLELLTHHRRRIGNY